MKTLTTSLFFLLTFYSTATFAQKKIAVQSTSTTTFYTSIDSAITHASNGDIIYVPGGTYVIPTLTINKGVQIFGAGHYPDSTTATGQTILTGDVKIVNGADNGSISGLYIMGNIYFGTTLGDQLVNNFGINRCSMIHLYLSFDGTSPNNCNNIFITENVIRGSLFGGLNPNVVYSKNIINGTLVSHSGSVLQNNLFLLSASGCGAYFLSTVNGCSFTNNIISYGSGGTCGPLFFQNSDFNVFSHNLFRDAATSYFPNYSNFQNGNFFSVIATDLFQGGTGYTFSYAEDYHMLATCVAHNGGTDGTDPGIYGSNDPYKEGAVPSNPHIQTKAISSSTDAQGNLNVNIKVAAQQK